MQYKTQLLRHRLTSPVLLAEIREPPDVTEADAEPEDGKEKLYWAVPCDPLLLLLLLLLGIIKVPLLLLGAAHPYVNWWVCLSVTHTHTRAHTHRSSSCFFACPSTGMSFLLGSQYNFWRLITPFTGSGSLFTYASTPNQLDSYWLLTRHTFAKLRQLLKPLTPRPDSACPDYSVPA